MPTTTDRQKFCWVATETSDGWRVKASVGPRDYPVRGLVLATRRDVSRLLGHGGIVFVHMCESREPVPA